MDIKTVKIQPDGYLVNDLVAVPASPGNRHYALIQEWIAEGNVPEPQFTPTEIAENTIASNRASARQERDAALDSLVHDFGDGRIIQTRPKDEQNIRNAMEVMVATGLTSIDWVMEDNVKYPVVYSELQAALTAGQMAAMGVWSAYAP